MKKETKFTKSKIIFPSADSLMKMLYLVTMDITKKGLDTVLLGFRSIPSWKFILKKIILIID